MTKRRGAVQQPRPTDWTRYRPPGNRIALALILVLLAAWIAFLIWMAV